MFISPFTPLFFTPHKSDGADSPYIQTFAPTDRILVEVLCPTDEPCDEWALYAEPGHKLVDWLYPMCTAINAATEMYWLPLSPSPGTYTLEVCGRQSDLFRVTSDERELRGTTLIQYSHKNDLARTDVRFFIGGLQQFFDFRVPGGFKDSQWTFAVDNEQFLTPTADIMQLLALESTQKKFTMGTGQGVPVWFGEMLNRILTCSHVYFDGVKYTRKDSAVPEMAVLLDGVNSFVFNQQLQQSVNLDPTLEAAIQTRLRRLDGHAENPCEILITNTNKLRKV